MKFSIGVFAVVFFFFRWGISEVSECNGAVTYSFSGGRFGDNLLSYLHAKWLSYRYQIPLLYKSFPYSSELMMDVGETSHHCSSQQEMELKDSNYTLLQSKSPYLYICPYFSENLWDVEQYRAFPFHFNVDWKDLEFRGIARRMIAPKNPLNLIRPPKHTINIAIHFREGGGYDGVQSKFNDPLKFPHLQFYIDSLNKILSFFKDNPIYCYFFTDAVNPELIVEKLKNAVHSENPVLFDYRKTDNHHTANVLEDFFSIFQFDILIRPQSNFSTVPSLLHDYAIICIPTQFSRNGAGIAITKFDLEINQRACDELQQRLSR